jgi:2-amino-4-hydroxy-6-hydroxymethyldihydropteridine diphosphokinase
VSSSPHTQTNTTVAIALGSNLGDRRGHLEWAVLHLSHVIADLTLSTVFETEPVDVPDVQPPYLNAVMVGNTMMPAPELLGHLQVLERKRGRTRTSFRGARTLDLDLILYGDEVISDQGLEVPHPRFRERRFVLEPLASLAPEMRDPVTGKTVAELLATLEHRS